MSIQSKAQDAIIVVSAMANPHCPHPRKRLAKMRRILEGGAIDRLDLARVLLADVGAENCSPRRRALWSKTTKRLADETSRRYRVVRSKAKAAKKAAAKARAEVEANR